MRKLKILMVAPQPYFTPRGTPFSVLHRIRALLAHGHTIDLITYPIGEDIPMKGLNIIRSSSIPFVKKVKIGPSISKLFLDMMLYHETVKTLRLNSYDVIHTHEEATFFGIGLAAKYQLPHIYDMHSSLPQQLNNFGRFNYRPIRRVFEYLERRVLTTCDGVITICDDLAKIVKQECPDKPHKMIHNIGDDRKVFSSSEIDLKDKLGLTNNKVLLYTGTFEVYQGLGLLFESMPAVIEQVPSTVLVMVGGQKDQIEKYRHLCSKLGISSHVRFVGIVHPSKISAYLDIADVIVSPRTRGTNTPLKIYGYLRAGKPLVATSRFTHTQILNDSISELVGAENFAAGIIRVLENPEYANKLARAAKQFADENFSDDSYIYIVNQLYDQVLDKWAGTVAEPIEI